MSDKMIGNVSKETYVSTNASGDKHTAAGLEFDVMYSISEKVTALCQQCVDRRRRNDLTYVKRAVTWVNASWLSIIVLFVLFAFIADAKLLDGWLFTVIKKILI